MRNITTSRKAVYRDGHSEITSQEVLVIPALIRNVFIFDHVLILDHISILVNAKQRAYF